MKYLVLIIVLAAVAIATYGQRHKSIEYEQPTRIELRSLKDTYVVGEPVLLTALLHNDTDHSIRGKMIHEFDVASQVEILYRRHGDEFKVYTPKWLAFARSLCSVVVTSQLGPHQSIERRIKLFYDTAAGRLVLDDAGDYDFRIVYSSSRTSESFQVFEATVTVHVLAPAARDVVAVSELRDPLLAAFLEGDIRPELASDEDVEAAATKAAEFVARHGKCAASKFVRTRALDILTNGRGHIDSAQLPDRLKGAYQKLERSE